MAKPRKQTEDEVLRAAMERVQSQDSSGDEDVDVADAPPTQTAAPDQKPKTGGKLKAAKTVKIAYHPGREDSPFTTWFGVRFEANIPRDVSHPELIRLASTNPFFSVDGKRAPKHRPPPKSDEDDSISLEGRSGLPGGVDPDKYEIEVEDAIAHES